MPAAWLCLNLLVFCEETMSDNQPTATRFSGCGITRRTPVSMTRMAYDQIQAWARRTRRQFQRRDGVAGSDWPRPGNSRTVAAAANKQFARTLAGTAVQLLCHATVPDSLFRQGS